MTQIGPYRARRLLGAGGMAEVYLAADSTGRLVALKVLGTDLDPELARRLDREGTILAGVDHPHIVRTLDHGLDPRTGRPFVALEYVPGRDLHEVLQERPGHRLGVMEAACVIDSCASALEAIHGRGVVHRDLKPSNVLLTDAGVVKLIDFGIALALGASTRLTGEGEMVGTPEFVPPEVVCGDQDWTAAADRYALGCLAFQVLAGRPPFLGTLREVLEAHVQQPPPSLAELVGDAPAALCALVEGLLAKDPLERPTLEGLRRGLSGFLPDPDSLGFWTEPAAREVEGSAGGPLLAPGSVFGKFLLDQELGRGGMGVVYRADHLGLKRQVALKLMLNAEFASPEARRRFRREAESVAALEHPNVVHVFDVGEEQGIPFLSMELVDGQPLSAFYPQIEDLRALLRTFTKICDGVQHAHLRGVIHRDLKPANVIVDPNQDPHILDFGVAMRMERGEPSHTLTADGMLVGTLRYMPPEQAAGEIDKVDVRSDVYALGAILYELVTGGKTPFGGSVAQLLHDTLYADPPPPSAARPGVPWELDAICLKALEKDQDRRYQSALDLRRDVERYLEGTPIHARQASLAYRLRKGLRRHRGVVAALLLLTLSVSGLVLQQAWVRGARLREISRLLEAARAAPLAERPQRFSEILGLDPENPLAQVEREAAQRELEARESLRLEKARQGQKLAEEALRREQAQRDLRRIREREQARRTAADEARRAAERRARAALSAAAATNAPLEAIGKLSDGLVLVPKGSGALRRTLERELLEVAIKLVQGALAQGQAGLASYWLDVGRKVSAAKGRARTLGRLARSLRRLKSGQRTHAEAQELMRRGEWLAARDKLLHARARGVRAEVVLADLRIVRARCRAQAEALLVDGRRLLNAGSAERSLAKARAALRLSEGKQPRRKAHALLEECALRVAQAARLRAHSLFLSGGAKKGLSILEAAVRTIGGTQAHSRLHEEVRHRRMHLTDKSLAGMVYVPAIARAGNRPYFISRTEVTNIEYRRFVRAGGYRAKSLFDKAAHRHVASFVDATPGAAPSPGPRHWRYGSFGDPAHGARPVRGITWYEARAYAAWLSRTTKQRWRLPTVREWELAAGWDPLLGRLRRYPWGPAFAKGNIGLALPLAREVGRTPTDRSPLGLLDAGGNVSEWVEAPGRPPGAALKGASFPLEALMARHQARVRATGRPVPVPPRELTVRLGVRLVLEIGGKGQVR